MTDFGQYLGTTLGWFRLSQTNAPTLAGPGGRSDLEVHANELKKHKKRNDAWMLINGAGH